MKRYLILALPLALAACAKQPQNQATPVATTAPVSAPSAPAAATIDVATLSSRHWRLTDATDRQGQRIAGLFANAMKPLQLDFADRRFNVSNTCNRMSGAYSIQGNQLTFQRMASTLMACADVGLMALDLEVGKRLTGTFTVAPPAGTLVLTNTSGDVLTFNGVATAESLYAGTGDTIFLEVAPQTRPCTHPLIANMQCLQVREVHYDAQDIKTGVMSPFQNFYASVEGYEHHPGVRNVLRIKRYKRKPAPADGSSMVYVLDMVVESEVVER